jgi:hypothetical protein
LTNEALDDPDSHESLDSFLAELVRKLRAEVAEFRADASRDAVAPILDELAERVKTFCASPYHPIEKLLDAWTQTTANFYNVSGEAVPQKLWDHALWKISFLSGRVGLSFAPDIHLQIRTKFGTDEPLSAEIDFKVIPRWLDIKSIATMPRVMLHEYIAHVPQGPFIKARIYPDANDAFAEGWMDYVAHHIHQGSGVFRECPFVS